MVAKPATVASLASGAGALEMALKTWRDDAPVEVRWHAEIEPNSVQVLKTWWPEVPNLGDLTAEGFWEAAERCDIHVGGIPCQPFSAAGLQLGEADARHLWPFWRFGIELHRPETIVFENVANLTRGKMRPVFDSIIADLLALGYDVRWCLLGACAVGAAHHRHRVFLLACRTRTTPNAAQIKVQTCGQAHAAYLPSPMHGDAGWSSRHYANHGGPASMAAVDILFPLLPTPSAVSYGSNQGGGAGRTGPVRHSLDALARLELLPTTAARDGSTRGEGTPEFWEARRALGGDRATAGIPLGAALSLLPTPRASDTQGAASAERTLRSRAGGRTAGANLRDEIQLLRPPTARDGDGTRGQGSIEHMRRRMESGHTINLGDQVALLPLHAGDDRNIVVDLDDSTFGLVGRPERWGKYAEAIARHEAVLGRAAPEPTEIGPKGGRRLAAAFSEWLMMLPEGHLTSVLDRNPALARAGNGVVPLQAATALELLAQSMCEGPG